MKGLFCPIATNKVFTVDFSSLRICVTMSVRACVSGANHIVYILGVHLFIRSRTHGTHSYSRARTHAHGHANSKRAEINCTKILQTRERQAEVLARVYAGAIGYW